MKGFSATVCTCCKYHGDLSGISETWLGTQREAGKWVFGTPCNLFFIMQESPAFSSSGRKNGFAFPSSWVLPTLNPSWSSESVDLCLPHSNHSWHSDPTAFCFEAKGKRSGGAPGLNPSIFRCGLDLYGYGLVQFCCSWQLQGPLKCGLRAEPLSPRPTPSNGE